MKLYSEIHLELLIILEVHKVTSRPVVSWRNVISSQPDFNKVVGRFQVDPQAFRIYSSLLGSKICFFSAYHLGPSAGEPEIFTAIFLKHFFLTPTPEFDVTVTIVIYVL